DGVSVETRKCAMAPVNPYPPEWDDDERMSFLFSAFKQSRDVNTADWDSKMAFWVPTILQYAQSQGLVSVALHQLQTEFTRKGSVPLGLPIVMQEMVRQGSLQRESDFVAGVTSGWLSWGMSQLVIRPLRWTAGKILGVQISPDEAFVVPEVLKKWAELLLMQYRSSSLNSSPVLHEKDVRMLWAEICPKSASLNLVLLQLQRDKRICMMERSGEKLVKFVQEGMSLTPIGEADVGILELRKCEKLLSVKLQNASEKTLEALRCMRRRKLAEHRVSELQNKVDTVQNILERISTAETDRKVVTAYEGGVSALRLAMKDVSVDKAESLVDQIQEHICTRSIFSSLHLYLLLNVIFPYEPPIPPFNMTIEQLLLLLRAPINPYNLSPLTHLMVSNSFSVYPINTPNDPFYLYHWNLYSIWSVLIFSPFNQGWCQTILCLFFIPFFLKCHSLSFSWL
uniref:Charged multivesicular body protein 7 n=1 Tax=Leptobrachium leishanense TaxID=445787 RepID=A0A8C5QTX5_9ANUR